jgi:CheY-like chemotaxis protein
VPHLLEGRYEASDAERALGRCGIRLPRDAGGNFSAAWLHGESRGATARLARTLRRLPSMKRVMIVDDDVDIRRGIVDALELEGYEVVEAADGREALQKLQRERPAAIVLDLMMPGMNGWQFRDEQQRDPEIASIPVIVVSARSRDHVIPGTTYVAKPFGVDTLLDAIARCAA